jgi:hypothetical protein
MENKELRPKLGFRLLEGRLSINVAKIGDMNPYVKVVFDKEIWKSVSSKGMHPKWNDSHKFIGSPIAQSLEVTVYDKGFIFGDTEIGKRSIVLNDVIMGHSTEWWDILNPKNEIVGALLISFEFHEPDLSFTHSTNFSCDLRGHHYAESSPIVPRIKKMQSIEFSYMTPESHKTLNFSVNPEDEAMKLEQKRFELFAKKEKLKAEETNIIAKIEKLNSDSNKLRVERIETKKNTEALKAKEELILYEKRMIENEKLMIEQGKEEVARLRESLNTSFNNLKQEKLKLSAERRLLEKKRCKLTESYKQIEQQKNKLIKCSCDRLVSLDRDTR